MKPFGIVLIAIGGLLLFFGAVIGFETGFGHLRVMNLPMVIMGGVGLLSGIILYAAGSMVAGNFELTNSAMPLSESSIVYDSNKWSALVKYDNEIALIAEKLKPLGQKWVDEFASSYLALNDKSYLPSLIHKIIAEAKKEDEEASLERERKTAEDLAQKALEESVFIEQASKGPQQIKKWSVKDRAFMWGGVLFVVALITAGVWFVGLEKELRQADYELQASELVQKLSDIRARMSVEVALRRSLYTHSNWLVEQAPKLKFVSGWSCIIDEVSMERGWIIVRCANSKVSYRLQFDGNQQNVRDKLINANKGERIIFSGAVNKNVFSETADNNDLEVFATLDASK